MTYVPLGPQAFEDEVDLDWHDEAPDPNADARDIAAPKYVRTEYAPHAHDDWTDWRPIFAALREFREAKTRKIERGGEIVAHLEQTLALPAAPSRLVRRLERVGFDVRTQATAVLISPLLFMGSTDEHDAGDVRTPQHAEYRWCVQARLEARGQRVAALWATWENRDVPGGKAVNKFVSALTWDVVGGRGYEPTATGFDEWVAVFAPKA